MENFTYRNPVRIVFGKNTIRRLSELVPAEGKTLLTYGSGSIFKNGVHRQVMEALGKREVIEFGGIEPNPRYETLMKAVDIARRENVEFLLSVGGGSVLDGTKFIAAAIPFESGDPWEIVSAQANIESAVPLGSVLTLPATGSEMNCFAVISRDSTRQKLAFGNPLVYPVFSILDPDTTMSLPAKQVRNGIVDAWVHVLEQYLTYPAEAPLQDRQAEAVLLTLLEEGPKTLADPADYRSRANFMWSATVALNGSLACGVPEDWATHMIGHEITAVYGLDHAETLAIVLPGLMRHRIEQKLAKLSQYAERVWGAGGGSHQTRALDAIERTARFFNSLGMPTSLAGYGITTECPTLIAERLRQRGATALGERGDLGPADVEAILRLCC